MRSKEIIAIGLVLLMVSPVLFISSPQTSMAANTVRWREVDPPAAKGMFISQVCGDVNDDGHLDLIGGIKGLGVRVIAGDGDGSWTALGAITTSGTYYGLDVGDVNHDGKLDVVAAEDGSGIYIWLGDGAGGWTLMDSPTGTGEFRSVALADINGDGKLDIAAGSGEGDGLKVWTGNGAGIWVSASTDLPVTGNYTDVALGDVDRDGTPDLVAASHGDGVRAWRRHGASWIENSTGLPASGDYIALGDLDNDGDLDVVVSGDGVGVQAWRRGGEAAWTWSDFSSGLPHGDRSRGASVGLSDVNNDGKLDIAAASYDAGVGVWTGDGGGTWTRASDGLPVTGAFYGLTLGDFNDDGMPDLSAGHDAGVRAWLDAGTPDVLGGWNAIASPASEGSYQGLDVADWNHDGKLDVVAASSDKGIRLWQGDGGNTWDDSADWTSPDLPTSGNYAAVQFGDIDHNGWLDVVAGSGADQGIRVWLFLDDVAWIEASGELPDSGAYFDIDLGDLNNDGYLDIAAVGKELGVAAWTAEDFDTSSPGWDEASFGLPGSSTFLGVALADLNHDGCLDIVASSVGAGLGIWEGDGSGDWYARTTPTDSGTWPGIAVGDVNDDGQFDLVAASDSLGVQVWAGDGSFGWTPLAPPTAAGEYAHVDLGDLNNDGKLDVLASKTTGLEVWTGDGGAAWTPFSVNLPTTGSYADAIFGEIDNDGVLDLIGAETNPGGVHAWTGAEGAPPSGWDNFSPTDWITETRKVDVSIQVQDTGSGLDVDSAEFAILEETGWSAWQHADCTGDKDTTAPQTISAQDVTFSRDSGPYPHDRNQVRFRIQDMAGNLGYSGDYSVYIDTTPPTNPTDFASSHPPAGGWQNDNTVDVDWDGAADETSGMEYGRYSYVFTTSCDLPVTIVDTAASMATSDPLDDGGWYISVRTRDTAGVWAPDAACDGPYRIDTQPPTNPTGFDASHEPEVWSNADTFSINWWGADDAGSGVFGYGWEWTEYPRTTPRSRKITETTAIVEDLDEGDSWYFHVRAQDSALNWATDTVHWGPFYVDFTDPISCSINAPSSSRSGSFRVEWSYDDAMSGVASYDVQVRDGAAGAWTDWQVRTTSTSATYTGGDDLHTYYFRVRARDRGGNLSGYNCQDETIVELPPSVSMWVDEGWIGDPQVYKLIPDADGPAGQTFLDVVVDIMAATADRRTAYATLSIPGDAFGPPVSVAYRYCTGCSSGPVIWSDEGGGRYLSSINLVRVHQPQVHGQLVFRFAIPPGASPGVVIPAAEVRYSLTGALLATADAPAVALVNYVPAIIVTNRHHLYLTHYNRDEAAQLLGEVTQAAQGPGPGPAGSLLGAIYYVDDYSTEARDWDNMTFDTTNESTANSVPNVIDRLIEDWVEDAGGGEGFLLILGDDDVIPFGRRTDGCRGDGTESAVSESYPALSRVVSNDFYFTDNWYADTDHADATEGELELNVGRIVGDTAADMLSLFQGGLRGPNYGPSPRAVLASWDHSDLHFPAATYASVLQHVWDWGFAASDDMVDNDDWRRDDLLTALRTQFGLMISSNHGNPYGIAAPPDKVGIQGYEIANVISATTPLRHPFYGFGDCRVGFTLVSNGLIDRLIHEGASGFVAGAGITWGMPAGSENYTEEVYNNFWRRALSGEEEPVGNVLRRAKADYSAGWRWSCKDQKGVMQMILFGVPWMEIPRTHSALAASMSEVGDAAPGASQPSATAQPTSTSQQSSAFSVPKAMPDGSYTITTTIDASSYGVTQPISGFEVVEVEGFQQQSLEGPLLPSQELVFSIPLGAAVTGVSAQFGEETNLGTVNIPTFVHGVTVYPGGTDHQWLETPPEVGIIPTEPYTHEVKGAGSHQVVHIHLIPVTYDAASDQATLFRQITLTVNYTTPAAVAVTDLHLDAPTHPPGGPVTADAEVVNVTDAPVVFTTTLRLTDAYGTRVSVTAGGPFAIPAGASAVIAPTFMAPNDEGTYHARLTLWQDGTAVAQVDDFVQVVALQITGLDGPDGIFPGETATYTVTVANHTASPVETGFALNLTAEWGGAVATLTSPAQTVPAGGQAAVTFAWHSAGSPAGRYQATALVTPTGYEPRRLSRRLQVYRTIYLPLVLRSH